MTDTNAHCAEQTARPPRFYTAGLSADEVSLPADQAHHARNVMRLKVGDTVELFDGAGCVVTGLLSEIGRREARVSVESRVGPVARPEPMVELAFAVPRGKRVDMLLEKATELGVARLQPIIFQRSVAGGAELSQTKRDRWMGHCIAAAKQCGLNFLPELAGPLTLDDYLTRCTCEHKLAGDLGPASQTLAAALCNWANGQDICVLVGPEGDMSPTEWPAIRQAGFAGVRLGQTALRVETAAIALLAGVTAICDGMCT